MQLLALFLGEPFTAITLAAITLGAPRIAAAAIVLIPVPVALLRLGMQECAGAAPVAGIGRRWQQQRTHCNDQEQQFHKSTRRSTPRLAIMTLIIDLPVGGA